MTAHPLPLVPAHDADVHLLIPTADDPRPEVTILVPALNEELTIGRFVDWCHEGIAASGARVEILIVDSSTDRTADIALARGARVLKVPKRGLGRAYIDAIPFVRGDLVIMGDADCTYDFRTIKPFIEAFRAGAEFIMGSRFRGSIEPGAMPALHRYFGTPVTTAILNVMFGSRFTDIHCGMRGIATAALRRMNLRSQGWEYASEMVLKSVHMRLATAEVPIHFLKDPKGRESHMKRRGWMEPWRAGWMNLRAMLVYGVDFFLMKPGIVLLTLGLVVMIPLTFGPLSLGRFSISLNTMLLAMAVATLGLSMLFSGAIAGALYDSSGARRLRIERMFSYNATILSCLVGAATGISAALPLVRSFVQQNYLLAELGVETHWAVMGLWLVMAAFQTFIFSLMIRALGVALPPPAPGMDRAASGERSAPDPRPSCGRS